MEKSVKETKEYKDYLKAIEPKENLMDQPKAKKLIEKVEKMMEASIEY